MTWNQRTWLPLCLTLALVSAMMLASGCERGDADSGQDAGANADQSATPVAAAESIGADGEMHPSEEDRCPVCAMTTHDRKMGAAIELSDGRTFYFCGPGCMLKSALHPDVFLGAGDATVERAVVTDFFTGNHVDASDVTWVAGSDVVGPMGSMIVPVVGDDALAAFLERHGGDTTFKWADLDEALWAKVTSKTAKPQGGE